jgi:hypothetical protein
MTGDVPRLDAFERRAFWAAFAVLAIITGWLPLRHHYLPFLDWPQHCAMASISSHLHDPKWGYENYYVENPWFFPYHVLRWVQIALGRVFGDGLGFRAALLVYLWGLPACAYALVRRIGRDRWLALSAFIVVVDGNLYWGFAPYVTGVALMLAANVITLDVLQRGGAWRVALLALVGVAVFFTHPQPAAMCAASCGLLALAAVIARRASFARLLAVSGALVPSFVMLCIFLFALGWIGSKGSLGHGAVLNQSIGWDPPSVRIEQLPWTSGLHMTGPAPCWVWLAALLVIAGTAAAQYWLRRRAGAERVRDYGFEIPVLVGLWLAMSFGLPSWYHGEPLAVRVPTLLALLVPWLAPLRPPSDTREARVLWPYRVVVVVGALVVLGQAHVRFSQFSRTMEPLDRVIDYLPRNSRVATLVYGMEPQGIVPLPTYIHIGGYVLAARGGMSSFSFVPYSSPEITRYALTALVWAPANGWQLPPSYTDFYDYVLVRKGASYPGTPFAPSPSIRKGTRVLAEGDFELWRTNRP